MMTRDGYGWRVCILFVLTTPSRLFADQALFHLQTLFLELHQPDSLRILTRTVGPAKEFSYLVGAHMVPPLSSHRPQWPGGQRGRQALWIPIRLPPPRDLNLFRLEPRPPSSLSQPTRAETPRARDAAAAIALELGVAPATVEKHLENIYRKLGATNRTAAAAALKVH